jgi:hypothetical protein
VSSAKRQSLVSDAQKSAAEQADRVLDSLRVDRRAAYELVAEGKQTIVATTIAPRPDSGRSFQVGGEYKVAIRFVDPHRSRRRAMIEHDTAYMLHSAGAPVVPPMHRRPIKTPNGGLVGIWEWAERSKGRIPLEKWGATLRTFHESGLGLVTPPYDPLQGMRVRDNRLTVAMNDPKHPLSHDATALERYRSAVREAFRSIPQGAASNQSVLHGDWHPSNAAKTRNGAIAVMDLEHSGRGPIAADFAIIAIGVRRYEWPDSHLDVVLQGYGPDAPTREHVEAFARIRELSFVGFSLLHATESPEARAEAVKRFAVVDSPHATTDPWVHVGNPATMQPSRLVKAPKVATVNTSSLGL